jgi:hypothetical protein
MKNLIKVLAISLLVFNFSSCTKEEKAPTETKTELLVSTPWVINTAAFTGITVYTKGGASNIYDASKISLTFKNDGTITATDLSGVAISGTWAFAENETKITLPPGLPFNEVVIDGLTKTNFDINVPTFTVAILGSTQTGKLTVRMVPKT